MIWMPDIVSHYLNTMNDARLNIIDVGCCLADFKHGVEPLLTKPSFWVGIDPVDNGIGAQYDVFIQKAILNLDQGEIQTFHLYSNVGCHSLKEMNTAAITHNTAEADTKWYVGFDIERKTGETQVWVDSLYNLLTDIPALENQPLHLVKIDAQGVDIDVFNTKTYILCYA